MLRTVAIILVMAGLVLFGMGFMASESFTSELSQFFTGEPSEKTIYLTGASVIALLTGGLLLAGSSQRSGV